MTGYAVTAQFYDPLASATHADIDRQIAAALHGLDVAYGPVIDVGAGTGLTTELIVKSLPTAQVWAIEPDATMRAALMTRVWNDLDLRERVTILPSGMMDAPLPDQIAGAVFSASLVHFGPNERERLWLLLAGRLATPGKIVIEIQCPEAIDMAEKEIGEFKIGQISYRSFGSAKRIEPCRQRWQMTYRGYLNNSEVTCEVATYDCWTISEDKVLEEAKAVGLAGCVVDNLVLLEHPRR